MIRQLRSTVYIVLCNMSSVTAGPPVYTGLPTRPDMPAGGFLASPLRCVTSHAAAAQRSAVWVMLVMASGGERPVGISGLLP